MKSEPTAIVRPRPALCIHMEQLAKERNYEWDPVLGEWLAKTCLNPMENTITDKLRGICGKLVPISSPECFSCHGTEFGPVTHHTIRLDTCHWRCTICKRVTPGCDVKACGYCGKEVTLLPPVVNVDLYGWNLVLPSPPADK